MFAAVSVVNLVIGLWWVAAASTAAAILLARAAWRGAIPKLPGAFAASAIGCAATSYWFDVFDVFDVFGVAPIEMRRGASVILWPAIAFVASKLARQTVLR